ncbi:hypothetical protein [Brevundimonas sp.]
MQKWLRAANPLMTPRAMAEAQWAAQSMVFALAISFFGGLPGSLWLILNPGWFTETLVAQQGAGGLTQEDLALTEPFFRSFMPILFGFGMLISAVVYGVLAWVQWRHMTRWIPVVWLCFVGYGLAMGLIQRLSGVAPVISVGPPWMFWLSLACSVVATVIAIAAARGAFMLHRLRREP